MPTHRISMRKFREVLRLAHQQQCSTREIAAAVRLSHTTVHNYLQRAAKASLTWPLPEDLAHSALEARLFPKETAHGDESYECGRENGGNGAENDENGHLVRHSPKYSHDCCLVRAATRARTEGLKRPVFAAESPILRHLRHKCRISQPEIATPMATQIFFWQTLPMNLEDVHAKTLTEGVAIGPEGELPAATGGWPEYTYALGPKDALPEGVSFTTALSADGRNMTGWLQGTPTEAMDPTPFRYTATDREGTSLTKDFILTVRSTFKLQRPASWIDTVFVEGRAIEDSLRLPEAINGSGDYSYWTEGAA